MKTSKSFISIFIIMSSFTVAADNLPNDPDKQSSSGIVINQVIDNSVTLAQEDRMISKLDESLLEIREEKISNPLSINIDGADQYPDLKMLLKRNVSNRWEDEFDNLNDNNHTEQPGI